MTVAPSTKNTKKCINQRKESGDVRISLKYMDIPKALLRCSIQGAKQVSMKDSIATPPSRAPHTIPIS